MVKTSHFGSNRSYGLAKAILLYSDGQEAFATVHEPKNSPDGGAPYLDAGDRCLCHQARRISRSSVSLSKFDDVVFTVEYSVRAAQMAVYELLGIERKIPPVTPHAKSLHVQFEALIKALE